MAKSPAEGAMLREVEHSSPYRRSKFCFQSGRASTLAAIAGSASSATYQIFAAASTWLA